MVKKMFVYTDNYGDDNNVRLVLNMYRDNDNLFVGLEEHDNEFDFWSPYCDVTVNISKLPFLESAINVNLGGQEKITFLIKNGFGALTDKILSSGFCQYPVFRFNAEKLKELDPEFFEKYALAHRQDIGELVPLNEQINDAAKQAAVSAQRSAPQKEEIDR